MKDNQAKSRKINFTHVAAGAEKNVCIAHIFKLGSDTEIYEYAVVKGADRNPESLYYKTWAYSIGYFKEYEDALTAFNEYMAN